MQRPVASLHGKRHSANVKRSPRTRQQKQGVWKGGQLGLQTGCLPKAGKTYRQVEGGWQTGSSPGSAAGFVRVSGAPEGWRRASAGLCVMAWGRTALTHPPGGPIPALRTLSACCAVASLRRTTLACRMPPLPTTSSCRQLCPRYSPRPASRPAATLLPGSCSTFLSLLASPALIHIDSIGRVLAASHRVVPGVVAAQALVGSTLLA